MVPFAPYLLFPLTIGWDSVGLSTNVNPLMPRLYKQVISVGPECNEGRDDLTEVSSRASNSHSHTPAPPRLLSEGYVESLFCDHCIVRIVVRWIRNKMEMVDGAGAEVGLY